MSLFNKISTQEKVDLARNLSLLIKSGAPIDRSFEILSGQSGPILKKILTEGKSKIEKGVSISEVFKGNPNFDKVFVGFIQAGEGSGSLSENLEFLGDWLDQKNTLEKEMSSATLYPKIIVAFAVVLGSALTFFVLPQMVSVFATLDVKLPITTRILIFVSDLAINNRSLLITGLFVSIISIFLLLKIKSVKEFLNKILLKMPIVGPLIKEYQLAFICQLAYILIKSGSTINNTLETINDSIDNAEYKKAVKETLLRVRKGTSFSESIKKYPNLFPILFLNVIAVGEETGSLGDSFDYLAKFFTGRVKEKISKLPVAIEPILLILIGFFVAFIASAIIMPIYEVTKGLY